MLENPAQNENLEVLEQKRCSNSYCLSWSKYSESVLKTHEEKILQVVRTPYRGWYVDIGTVVGHNDKIWTISFNTESPKTPLVLLHGFGAGVALWCLNLEALSTNRPVYAVDLLGFGRSSRPKFNSDGTEAEQQMVRSLEEWRKEMKLNEFILLGHSMGGFFAASYSLTYPDRIKHLILADPWGFPEKPVNFKSRVPLWAKPIAYMLRPFNPLASIRAAGPFGPWLVNTVRADIPKKYSNILPEPELISQYIYQCNSQHPSGESAFRSMTTGFVWAKNPMVNRIDHLDSQIPITLLYGSNSWLDHSVGEVIKQKRPKSYFSLQEISEAGHHVYSDNPEAFNAMVEEACNSTDRIIEYNLPLIHPDSTKQDDNPKSDNSIDESDNRH